MGPGKDARLLQFLLEDPRGLRNCVVEDARNAPGDRLSNARRSILMKGLATLMPRAVIECREDAHPCAKAACIAILDESSAEQNFRVRNT